VPLKSHYKKCLVPRRLCWKVCNEVCLFMCFTHRIISSVSKVSPPPLCVYFTLSSIFRQGGDRKFYKHFSIYLQQIAHGRPHLLVADCRRALFFHFYISPLSSKQTKQPQRSIAKQSFFTAVAHKNAEVNEKK
jgi:hypothetical protein